MRPAYFTSRETGWLQSSAPFFVIARKRNCTIVETGRPAISVFDWSVGEAAVQVLAPSTLHSHSYEARAATAFAATWTVPETAPGFTSNGALLRAAALRTAIPALVQVADADPEQAAAIIVEGIRWIALDSLSTLGPSGHLVARVGPVPREESDPAEVEALTAPLRARMRDLAGSFPDAARLVALVDQAPPDHLANIAIANLPVPVETKARYAAEPKLAERLRVVSALVSARK